LPELIVVGQKQTAAVFDGCGEMKAAGRLEPEI
jgi:hypothetical protein